jgi:phospholipid-binding lipoprotein MlaA
MRFSMGALALAIALTGCAAAPPSGELNPQDPWEAANRKVFAFNDKLDRKVVKPVARGYETVVPQPVREVVTNFFGNLGDAWSAVNWLLQGELQRSVGQGARFAWNTTLGLAGLFDVGTSFGLERRSQDFGQTLSAWGVGMGPYVVLPLLGPSSVRDVAALPANRLVGSNLFINDTGGQVAAAALEVVNLRAEKIVDGIALDKYTFFRDAYLQRRGTKTKVADDDGFEIIESPPAEAVKP